MKKTLSLVIAFVLIFALSAVALAAPVYFYDTYGEIKDKPTFMVGDKDWQGWKHLDLKDEGDGWFSYEINVDNIPSGYNMLIFFNGLNDDDANCVQYVWHEGRGAPAGFYFVADKNVATNPPENNYQGVQRDAPSFASKADAEAHIAKIAGGGGGDAPKTGDSVLIFAAIGVLLVSGIGLVALRKKVKE